MSKMYTDAHRLVVQAFLARGVMDEKDVKSLVHTACERCGVPNVGERVDNFIHQINSQLHKMAMEIKKKREEEDGAQVYALVQTAEHQIGKIINNYSPKELELFKEIVSKVITSENGEVSSTDCLNLADALERRITKDEAQNAVKKFVEERWLRIDEEGQISLAARGIMELQMFLQEKYSDFIVTCYLCQDIVVKGQLCDGCGKVKLHNFCAQRLFQTRPNPKCPACEVNWSHDIPHLNGGPVEETSLVTMDPSQPSTSGRRKRGTRR
ncbi:Non-structural maintenance of chromosomes element 1-like [Holothuria leucospilota]|uniref:Non-structural maintenance of chromosomes element 1 homolog n=1 Tax=Holothuria leucospilota TaxID=206669 RepID=A0A9Q1BWR9_HOLLE|nr:Non-structural maintenance of chromosomes element 1-like [Holothuria leucospilota]